MANVYALRSGSWSDPTMWNTLSLPTSGDDVFANNFVVQVDVTTTVLSVRTTAATPIVAGTVGTFILNDGSKLTCTAPQGIYIGSTTAVVQFAGSTGTSATLWAELPVAGLPNVSNQNAVLHSGTGTLNIKGDITFGSGGASIFNRNQFISNSTGTTYITGKVSSAGGGVETFNNCILMAGGKLFILGEVSGGGSQRGFIISGGTAEIQITGEVKTNSAAGITLGSSIKVIGNVTHTGSGTGIAVGIGTLEITGFLTINSTGAGVSSTTGGITVGGPISVLGPNGANNAVVSTSALIRCSGVLTNFNNWQAVYAPRITIESTTTSITFQKIGGGNQIMYIGTADNTNLPAVSDVRLGTTFGVSNEFTGTMAVQIPANVSQGALVDDNKIGTFLMTPASFVQELGVSTIPVAVRLQNSATVITTGTQLASFNI